MAFDLPPTEIAASTRHGRATALPRKVAVYLTHVAFQLPLDRVGLSFRRSRSLVGRACKIVEDLRDDPQFDTKLADLEDCIRRAPPAAVLKGGAA